MRIVRVKQNKMENTFTTADAVVFGNYLLSDERKAQYEETRQMYVDMGVDYLPVEDSLKEVHHADIENFLHAASL